MSSATVICISPVKTGAGATSLALSMARQCQERGERVLLIEADPQGVAAAVEAEGSDFEILAAPEDWLNRLDAARSQYNTILVDLPLIFDRTSLSALALADRFLLVTRREDEECQHLLGRVFRLFEKFGPSTQFVEVIERSSS
jgi:cellulose biosynthesis protein BcsQ